MARTLDTFPALPSQSRHDWDDCSNGRIWELKRGEDFSGQPKTFIANARGQARKRGGSVRTRMPSDDSVVIQFLRDR